MADIVGSLRHKAALKSLSGWGAQSQIAMGQAADEIERLREENERYRSVLETIAGSADLLQALQAKAALVNIGASIDQ